MTEAMIASSYKQLKRSVARAPSQVFSSAGETVRKHPLAAAAAAVGAGIALFGLFRLMTRQSPVRENVHGSRDQKSRPDMRMEILSLILPMVTPYIAGYVEKYMGRIFSRDRE